MNQIVPVRLPSCTMYLFATGKGGNGKTFLCTNIYDLLMLGRRRATVVQIDDQDRLRKTIGHDVITVDPNVVRQSRNNPSAALQAFRPLMTAIDETVATGDSVLLDIGASHVPAFVTFAELSELDDDFRELGIRATVFVPCMTEPESMSQAQKTLSQFSKALPNVRRVLVKNERDGKFNGTDAAEIAARIQTDSSLTTIAMPAIEGGSWRHFEPHFLRPLDVVTMDIADIMRLTGLPRAEAKICRGDVAAWVAVMEEALSPLLEIRGVA